MVHTADPAAITANVDTFEMRYIFRRAESNPLRVLRLQREYFNDGVECAKLNAFVNKSRGLSAVLRKLISSFGRTCQSNGE